ncbi:hypothetical protein JXA34_00145 [Patescibacteria group bacterium]|nr:hypothetical protein [Patescibacteria group bacterium]
MCGKTYQKGNLVPRGIGNRVIRRTITRKAPNLRTKRLEIDGKKVKITICASCLKRIKKAKRDYENRSAQEEN